MPVELLLPSTLKITFSKDKSSDNINIFERMISLNTLAIVPCRCHTKEYFLGQPHGSPNAEAILA